MKKYFIILLIAVSTINAYSQLPYTEALYEYDSIMNVSYGTATDYAGNPYILLADIYKPKNDGNCLRPIIVIVHGGAWIAGSKEDPNTINLSREYAKRGYVVANINYRLGTHKTSNYTMYALCNTNISAPCGYICDSSEIVRANYRGMQDTKGAIRFMKSRFAEDSTDINNVFVAGESAGAFIALATAFTDNESMKPVDCGVITNAPNPDSDLASYGCVPVPLNLERPDLGSIEGDLNTGIYNSEVQGVGSFYGAVFDLSIFDQSSFVKPVYIFHQGSDVIVNYEYGRVLGRISWECYQQSNICQPYYFYPSAYGGEAMKDYLTNLGESAPPFHADIIYNYQYLNNCTSNGHSVDNLQLRAQNMANLFADKIALSSNSPETNCDPAGVDFYSNDEVLHLYPNPANETVIIETTKFLIGSDYKIYDITSRLVEVGILESDKTIIDLTGFKEGTYIFSVANSAKTIFQVRK